MFFLTGCETDNSVTYSDEDRVVGTLHGVVTDAADNARMLDVTVTVVQKGAIFTTETDELGYYIVKVFTQATTRLLMWWTDTLFQERTATYLLLRK